jgi:hypothetical protein
MFKKIIQQILTIDLGQFFANPLQEGHIPRLLSSVWLIKTRRGKKKKAP